MVHPPSQNIEIGPVEGHLWINIGDDNFINGDQP